MQQKDEKERIADHGCFPFRNHILVSKPGLRNWLFEEDGWNLNNQNGSKMETQIGSQNIMSRKTSQRIKTNAMSIYRKRG